MSTIEMAKWEELSSKVLSLASPFMSMHYARAVADAGMDVRVCVISRDDVVCAFLPFQYANRLSAWTGTAEPLGGKMTDCFGLIAPPDFQISPNTLLKLAKLNYFGFSHLDGSQLAYGLTGEQPRVGLHIQLAQDTERPLDALLVSRLKYRKDSERCTRLLCTEVGPIEFRSDVQTGRKDVLEHLIRHKRMQYQRTSAPDALGEAWKSALLHKLSVCHFDSCRGLLSTMSAGGKWMATHFGIVGNGMLQYWLPVYNTDFSRYAPGRLLMHHLIESSRELAFGTIDYGEGDTADKRKLANEAHQLYRGVWHNKSLVSHLTGGVNSVKWRLGI